MRKLIDYSNYIDRLVFLYQHHFVSCFSFIFHSVLCFFFSIRWWIETSFIYSTKNICFQIQSSCTWVQNRNPSTKAQRFLFLLSGSLAIFYQLLKFDGNSFIAHTGETNGDRAKVRMTNFVGHNVLCKKKSLT